jgi:hypothetical protein
MVIEKYQFYDYYGKKSTSINRAHHGMRGTVYRQPALQLPVLTPLIFLRPRGKTL